MKLYLNGTSGIEKPCDFDGNEIKVGDILTYDYLSPNFADRDMSHYENKPVFVVKAHKTGNGLCAKGIDQELYLHDFRFKYCKKLKSAE